VEVEALPSALQSRLLRVLTDRAGGRVDVRVIASTTADLKLAVERGTFDVNLYEWLAVVELDVPPLRARVAELPRLVHHLLRRAGAAPTLSSDALEAIARHEWPHNIRQLDFALRRALVLSPHRIELEHLPEDVRQAFRRSSPSGGGRRRTAKITREQLEVALQQHRGNVRQVGKELGIHRSRLYRLLEKWALDPGQHRGTAHPLVSVTVTG
jgi:DNA-binding NtrC family response regulator